MLLKKLNLSLVILPILLFALGYMSLLSTTPERAKQQFMYFCVGFIIYLGLAAIDLRITKIVWRALFFIILALLLLTIFLGEVRSGSARWFDLGFFVIQPSEFAKFALVAMLASVLSVETFKFTHVPSTIKLFALFLSYIVLVFLQPDLGTAIILGVLALGLLFYAGFSKWFYVVGFFIAGVLSTPAWNLLEDYQRKRILVFLNPNLDKLGAGYNVNQSIIAVGSGRFWGKGFGFGSQSHLRFLPAYWTDFIFASFAEEWGFLGIAVLLILFAALCLTILYVVYKSDDLFYKLLSMGAFLVLFFQAVINIGMNLGVMPVTGIPLPLISYGGSSMITTMVLLGFAQSAWAHKRGLLQFK